MTGTVRILRARRIVTLDESMPIADAVAVADGKILHTGTYAEVAADLAGLGAITDDSFGDRVIVPGFIAGHSHLLDEGSLSRFAWVGSYDRRTPDGGVQPGCPTHQSALDRIARAVAETTDPREVVVCLGWDPGMANSPGLDRHVLDAVAPGRAVFVGQSNLHVVHCSSALLELADITRDTDVEGVQRDGAGEPTGTLAELDALMLVFGRHVRLSRGLEQGMRDGAALARQVGCTTVTDLAFMAIQQQVDRVAAVVETEEFPLRVIYAPLAQAVAKSMGDDTFAHLQGLSSRPGDKHRMGPVKFTLDGSIQGRTGQLDWPGYCCGDDHAMWVAEPAEMVEIMRPYHRAGLQLAMHTNGDRAIGAGLDIYRQLLDEHPRTDHRHRLEHVQMATEAMFRRMKILGVLPNLFANHIWYWGDIHREQTMGPAKARRLDACGTAHRLGIPFSIHCDAPVTPLDPLFTMWCAVNRLTSSGHVLGESERIDAATALRAVTLDSAYLLHLDHELGSIEVGKRADFAVLGEDPTTCDPMAIKDVAVHATVLGGQVNPN
ncbi:MAG: amidohydrolase [Actinomycetota bacterium]